MTRHRSRKRPIYNYEKTDLLYNVSAIANYGGGTDKVLGV